VVLAGRSGSSARFAVADRLLRSIRIVDLPGRMTYDALSPDGSRLYVIESLRRGDGLYRVRAVDLRSGRLLARPIADKSRVVEPMSGIPVARATTRDGAWVFTLYRGGHEGPFVHALDVVNGLAACLDLRKADPAARATDADWRLKLAADQRHLRAVNPGSGEAVTIAMVDGWPRILP
jgi:hypothetical protein